MADMLTALSSVDHLGQSNPSISWRKSLIGVLDRTGSHAEAAQVKMRRQSEPMLFAVGPLADSMSSGIRATAARDDLRRAPASLSSRRETAKSFIDQVVSPLHFIGCSF